MAYDINSYERLRIGIESLKDSVDSSRLEQMLSDLNELNKCALSNPVSDHPNGRQRDIDMIHIVYDYYKELYTDKHDAGERRTSGKDNKLYIAMLDIDDFGQFNKRFGDTVGDFVLAKTADIVRNTLRKDDVVINLSDEPHSYHLHGEEKLIIFKSGSDDDAANVAEKVREAIETRSEDEIKYKVTESIGLIRWNPDNESYFQAQKRADTNMQTAKKQGKNRVYFSNSAEDQLKDGVSSLEHYVCHHNQLSSFAKNNMGEDFYEDISSHYMSGRRFGGENKLYLAVLDIGNVDGLRQDSGKDGLKNVLEEISGIIGKTLRDEDVAFISDEKAWMLYKCRSDKDGLMVAEKVREAVGKESSAPASVAVTGFFPEIESFLTSKERVSARLRIETEDNGAGAYFAGMN